MLPIVIEKKDEKKKYRPLNGRASIFVTFAFMFFCLCILLYVKEGFSCTSSSSRLHERGSRSNVQDLHDLYQYNLGKNVTSETLLLHHHYFLTRTGLGEMKDEMKMFLYFIQYHIPFAVTRYADGEDFIIKGKKVGKDTQANLRDNWYWEEDRVGRLGNDLRSTLVAPRGLFFYGFPERKNWHYMINELVEIGGNTILPYFQTSANVFIDLKIEMKEFIISMEMKTLKRDIILMVNVRYQDKKEYYLKFVKDVYFLPDGGPLFFEDQSARENLFQECNLLSRKHSDAVFLISGGPISEPLIYKMWGWNPSNSYLDLGSALSHCYFNDSEHHFPNINPNVTKKNP